jgi:hypothetical protein
MYSRYEPVSVSNSNGTQIHHRSHLGSTDDDMQDDSSPLRGSHLSLPQYEPDLPVGIPDQGNALPFSQERCLQPVTRPPARASQEIFRHTLREPLEFMQRVLAERDNTHTNAHLNRTSQDSRHGLVDQNLELVGHRPPTPPRRRPRIPSIDKFSLKSHCNTMLSIDSNNSFATVDSRSLAEDYINEIAPLQNTLRDSARLIDPIYEGSESNTPGCPDHDFAILRVDEPDLATALSKKQRANTLNVLSGHAAGNSVAAGLPASQCTTALISREGSVLRRCGKVDWRDDLTGGTNRASSTLVSATGNEYGLGDHAAGYHNGVFATNIQPAVSKGKKQEKRLIERFLCS